ncbi:phage protease [Arhodomonas aquaeolei]|uniref:phage protease n=1 Tax=Arhodomonas aquaeolei TaxID=2369 RepID=UPI0021676723|nr:phage protease [Arhodomonas aquaeolei]MCS4503888.1 phage protease [Arhodomonas aquaeolei]
MAKALRTQIAACAARIRNAGREVQLIPAGEFRARDGRPHGLRAWIMNADTASRVIALGEARETPFVIDYEHQTLSAETSGQPAPAAAWFTELEWREGDGLYATDVEWTERARAMIEADEYRFVSPVFKYDPETGEVRELLMAAVTNDPAIDGIADLAAARYLATTDDHEEASTVDEETLKLLGLDKDASEDKIREAVEALRAKADKTDNLESELATAQAKAESAGGEPDPSKYVPVETVRQLQEQVATLTSKVQGSEVEQLVKQGLDDGRLLPAMEDWARELGKKDVAALRSYLESAQPIAALSGTQTGGQPPAGDGNTQLSDSDRAVCKQLGITEDEFLKQKEAN